MKDKESTSIEEEYYFGGLKVIEINLQRDVFAVGQSPMTPIDPGPFGPGPTPGPYVPIGPFGPFGPFGP
jgi:hypothetical protein